MNWIDALILGVLQGITEFLPISSSGHLILGESLLNLHVETLKSFDVVVHLGSLFAILLYFFTDVKKLLIAFWELIKERSIKNDPNRKLVIFIIIASIPAVIVGFTMEDMIDGLFRNVNWVAIWMLIIASVFLIGEYFYKKVEKSEMTWKKSLIVGTAQAFALIPGISRSGSTITASILAGLSHSEAARFSFLMSLPVIFGAGLLTALKTPVSEVSGMFPTLLIGFFSSFFAGLITMHFLMKFLKKHGLSVFAIYLLCLGSGILIYSIFLIDKI